jgi:phage tail-like protein
MPTQPRERPFNVFRFQVDLGPDGPNTNDFKAGFQEVAGLGMEVHVAEYRAGNDLENAPLKITGLSKYNDVTLKRGVIADITTLYAWWDNVRNGSQDELRTVRIQLMDDTGKNVVQQWALINARPIKYTAPAFNGKATDVAVEELVLSPEKVVVTTP